MTTHTTGYLPGTHRRGQWLRVDTASTLKRFFLCEQALIVSQAGWLANLGPFALKMTLPRLVWEDAMTANALRERVFELRFPSRVLDIGSDAPLVELFSESINAPSPLAYLSALTQVFKPALLEAYQRYIHLADALADGPSFRFLRLAITEKQQHLVELADFVAQLAVDHPEETAEAEQWVAEIRQQLETIGGLQVDVEPTSAPLSLSTHHPFQLSEIPARDDQFHLCRFYWPDMIDPTFPYGDGIRLQLRSAISHLNEVWAVETAGAILHAFAEILGWEFIYDAARWTYDESRHCQMGYERLLAWGFAPNEIPLGTYIYDSAFGQEPIYRLGMLYYFETKNIGKKPQRAKAFATYHDQVSQHDMDFDWADEAMHAHFGQRWIQALHERQPSIPPLETIQSRCDELVANLIATATEAERQEIRQVAEAMIEKAKKKIISIQ